MFRFVLIAIAAGTLAVSAAAAGTLDNIRKSGVLKLGYRADAPPFSYKNSIGEATGYSVTLCRSVAAQIKQHYKLDKLTIEYVPVTAENRFQSVQDGKIDLLCGATTATLSRREKVDFSLPTFVDGAGALLHREGPQTLGALEGGKIGVRAGTTTEDALRSTVEKMSISVETVAVKDHRDGISKLLNKEVSAYFADRAILFFLVMGSGSADKLFLSDRHLTYEPYALALRKGDSDFRLAVDRALSRLYRSGAIATVFTSTFGAGAKPSNELRALFRTNALLE